jgi:hypothetical protein
LTSFLAITSGDPSVDAGPDVETTWKEGSLMEETMSHAECQWSYQVFKNGVYVSPAVAQSSMVLGNEEELLIRVQGLSVRLFVRGEPVSVAPYLVYASPNIAGTIPVREYEGKIAGNWFGIYRVDADTDIDLIARDGTVWRGICALNAS